MAGSSFGQIFRVTTAGESHGPGNLVIVDGVPPGIPLDATDLIPDLRRRRPGQSAITTQRDEQDLPEILSGVYEGHTTGTPIAVLVRNTDQRSRDYQDIQDKFRPGHADYTFEAKFGLRDPRGGGRSSARETTARVAAGAIARKLLRLHFGVEVVGYVKQVGDVIAHIPQPERVTLEQVESHIVRCPDPQAAPRMVELIEAVRRDQDSIGGVCELVATGVPPGWGEPVFDKLKADLGKAMFSLPAVLGVEYGAGFAVATLRGSACNDAFTASPEPLASVPTPPGDAHAARLAVLAAHVHTPSNRHGGMLGGISSGMPIVLRCAIKPTSSLSREQPTVNRRGEPTTIRTKGRHDPCLLPRFVPMGEAMMLLVLADHALRHRAVTG